MQLILAGVIWTIFAIGPPLLFAKSYLQLKYDLYRFSFEGDEN